MGTFSLWELLELVLVVTKPHLHTARDGGWMEPECGINCISETLSEAKQDDICCKPDAACLALVTACCVLWNVDFQSGDLSGTVASASSVKSKLGLWGSGGGGGGWTQGPPPDRTGPYALPRCLSETDLKTSPQQEAGHMHRRNRISSKFFFFFN